MDRKQVMIDMAAVLTTAAEIGGAVPQSPLYLALGGDLDRFTLVRDVLVKSGLATVTAETLTLTEAGRLTAAKLEALALAYAPTVITK
jgi:hypothetical protein